ncbi:hypothetical protein INR49_009340 [Caranx melampygus]|nr:hypothetical protein INR49_009340 [Caranx melampygus]
MFAPRPGHFSSTVGTLTDGVLASSSALLSIQKKAEETEDVTVDKPKFTRTIKTPERTDQQRSHSLSTSSFNRKDMVNINTDH